MAALSSDDLGRWKPDRQPEEHDDIAVTSSSADDDVVFENYKMDSRRKFASAPVQYRRAFPHLSGQPSQSRHPNLDPGVKSCDLPGLKQGDPGVKSCDLPGLKQGRSCDLPVLDQEKVDDEMVIQDQNSPYPALPSKAEELGRWRPDERVVDDGILQSTPIANDGGVFEDYKKEGYKKGGGLAFRRKFSIAPVNYKRGQAVIENGGDHCYTGATEGTRLIKAVTENPSPPPKTNMPRYHRPAGRITRGADPRHGSKEVVRGQSGYPQQEEFGLSHHDEVEAKPDDEMVLQPKTPSGSRPQRARPGRVVTENGGIYMYGYSPENETGASEGSGLVKAAFEKPNKPRPASSSAALHRPAGRIKRGADSRQGSNEVVRQQSGYHEQETCLLSH